MRLRPLLVSVLVISATLACARLGAWQLSRLAEKRALNAELRARLAAPPLAAGARIPGADAAHGRKLEFTGGYDGRFHVVLRGRMRDGEPGVNVVTPFVLPGDSLAVLVDRGWLAAEDAATLDAGRIPPDSSSRVAGVAREFEPGAPIPPLREIGDSTRRVWSAPRLDPDSLAARVPYRLAPYVLLALPGSDAPPWPARRAPREHDEATHLGYAIQWFATAVMIPAITLWVVRRKRAARR